MKNLLSTLLLLLFVLVSCDIKNENSITIDDFEIINEFEKTVFIVALIEVESSHLVDIAPTTEITDAVILSKIEPTQSLKFYTQDIDGYYQGADFNIYIYTYAEERLDKQLKKPSFAELFTTVNVENKTLIKNNAVIVVSK